MITEKNGQILWETAKKNLKMPKVYAELRNLCNRNPLDFNLASLKDVGKLTKKFGIQK